jgi:hypothetical protein
MDDLAIYALDLIMDDRRIQNIAGIETEKRLGRGRLNDADDDPGWWQTYSSVIGDLVETMRTKITA